MNNQDAFNRIWRHFVVDKQPLSTNSELGSCYYRHPETGAKCAVGILIPDDQCPPDIDNGHWPLTRVSAEVPALRGCSIQFLRAVQNTHDSAAFAVSRGDQPHLERDLRNIAGRFNLVAPAEGAPV